MNAFRYRTLMMICLLASAAFAQDNAMVDLYKAKCAKCHGADGTTTAGGKRLGTKDMNATEVRNMSDAEWTEVTVKGKGKMPAYGKSMSDEQIKSLIAYMRGLLKKK